MNEAIQNTLFLPGQETIPPKSQPPDILYHTQITHHSSYSTASSVGVILWSTKRKLKFRSSVVRVN